MTSGTLPKRRRRGWCAEGCGKRGNVEDRLGNWHCWHHAAEQGLLSVKKPLTPFTPAPAGGRMTAVAQEGRVKKEKPA